MNTTNRQAPPCQNHSRAGNRPAARPLKAGALFAGYGGLDLAVEEVFGAHPAWVSEIETAPSRLLAARFPGVPNLGDITEVDWHTVEPVDIISGGSPCQDLSHAGMRAGMNAGTRSGLWASMCDAIAIIRPKFVVWENVRGALSATATAGDVETCDLCVGDAGDVHLRALGRVLGDLSELGYDAAWHGLRAADVGAPHGRWRVFVLAWRADTSNSIWPLPDGDGSPATDPENDRFEGGLRGRPAALGTGTASASTAADPDRTTRRQRGFPAAGEAQGGRPWSDAGRPDRAPVTLLPTPAVNDMGAGKTVEDWDAWTARMKAAHGNGHGKPLSIEAQRLLPTPTATDRKASGASYAPSATHHAGTTLTDATVRQPERFGEYAPAIARWEAVLGRPAPAPTEPTGRDGSQRLSPRFVEWLMGLPDGWVTDVGLTRNEELKMLGNGAVPQQAVGALRHLMMVREWALRLDAA